VLSAQEKPDNHRYQIPTSSVKIREVGLRTKETSGRRSSMEERGGTEALKGRRAYLIGVKFFNSLKKRTNSIGTKSLNVTHKFGVCGSRQKLKQGNKEKNQRRESSCRRFLVKKIHSLLHASNQKGREEGKNGKKKCISSREEVQSIVLVGDLKRLLAIFVIPVQVVTCENY